MAEPYAGGIPRGIEVLVKKAAVDPDFRTLLLTDREEAARRIDLELGPAEAIMLRAVPQAQLEAIIARTHVPEEHRRAFLGHAAAAMLAVLGAGTAVAAVGARAGGVGGIMPTPPAPTGIRPDVPDRPEPKPQQPIAEQVVEIIARILEIELPKPTTQNAEPGAVAPRPEPMVPFAGAVVRTTPAPEKPGPKGKEKPELELAIPREKRLIEDLKATPKQLVTLRRAVEEHFEIKIPYVVSRKLKTVGDWIVAVEDAVRRREAAKKRPTRPSPAVSRGIRPDRPPSGGTFGLRP